MEIKLEEIVPRKIKLSRSCQVFIPTDMRDFLGWSGGQFLEVYPTRQGIFIKERSKTKNV